MGFLRNIARAVGANAAQRYLNRFENTSSPTPFIEEPTPGSYQLTGWSGMKAYEPLFITSENEMTAFTYLSAPLKGLRKGSVIDVVVFNGTGFLVSSDTGFSSLELGSQQPILLYKGKPFGFLPIPLEVVKRAAENGYQLHFKAKCYGTLEGYQGIKDIRVFCPERLYLHDWIEGVEDDRPLFMRENYLEYLEATQEALQRFSTKDRWHYDDVVFELGESSAARKPIRLIAPDGTILSKVTSRKKIYEQLLRFMEDYKKCELTATRVSSHDTGKIFYKIELLGRE